MVLFWGMGGVRAGENVHLCACMGEVMPPGMPTFACLTSRAMK